MEGTQQQVFSNEFLICTEIYKYNTRGEIVWFNKLADDLKGSVSQATVSKCLDYLFDKGMVDADWEKNPDTGRWVRSLKVAGEFTGFIAGLVRAAEQVSD